MGVGLVVVVLAAELHLRPEITLLRAVDPRELAHVDGAPLLGHGGAAEAADRRAHEDRRLVLEGVEVEVHPQLAHARRRDVAPRDRALAVHGVRRGIELRAQRVVDHLLGVLEHGHVHRGRRRRSCLRGRRPDGRAEPGPRDQHHRNAPRERPQLHARTVAAGRRSQGKMRAYFRSRSAGTSRALLIAAKVWPASRSVRAFVAGSTANMPKRMPMPWFHS